MGDGSPTFLRTRLRVDYLILKIVAHSVSRARWRVAAHYLRVLMANCVATLCHLLWNRRSVECNFCGWEGNAFFPMFGTRYLIPRQKCPLCGSLARTRLLLRYIQDRPQLLPEGARILEAAPLAHFQQHFRRRGELRYLSFDLVSEEAMLRTDITRLGIRDGSVDLLVCYHVLEHVPDDRAAMRELHRVLAPGGRAIVQVPLDESLARTREYGAEKPEEHGHVRAYGADYRARLEEAGFRVQVDDLGAQLDPETVRRHGLTPERIHLLARAPVRARPGG